MVAARNTLRYPVARQNQAMPEFDPIALRTTDAKGPTTHTFPGGRGEPPVDSPFSADHGDPGAVAQLPIRRGKRPIKALNTGLSAIAERLSELGLFARVSSHGLLALSGASMPRFGWFVPGLSHRRDIHHHAA